MDDSCLICFFSYGRRELVEEGFHSLRENRRPQDRILVFDQMGLNADFYLKYKDEIDFFFVTKLNYEIGPVWLFIKQFILWKEKTSKIFVRDTNKEKGWYPAFVNILECDTVGKAGWIDRVLRLFDSPEPIGIASGYNGEEHPTLRQSGETLVKDITSGVNMIIKTDYFLSLFDMLGTKGQDWEVCRVNKANGKVVGVIPNEIRHTGTESGRSVEAKGRWG